MACNGFAAVGTLQRLASLLASQVDDATKMQVAAEIADATTKLMVADRKTDDQKPRMCLDYAQNILNVVVSS